MPYKAAANVLWFADMSKDDIPIVGGKTANLSELYNVLTKAGIAVPGGFATTAKAYREVIKYNNLDQEIERILTGVDTGNMDDLHARGEHVRRLILNAKLPDSFVAEIKDNYQELSKQYKTSNLNVATRSSATAEDLPGASFAGQTETYLNVKGIEDVLHHIKMCFASLFTDRSISYREDKGFSHFDVALSVIVQKMVRADKASSGVMFTIDTETGFNKVIVINGSYGLGEMIVQGQVTPDEFIVFKPLLAQKQTLPIIQRQLGQKSSQMIYGKQGTVRVDVSESQQTQLCLQDSEVLQLARWGEIIEKYYSQKAYQPMDIEWAKDGQSGELYIVQARPETVHALEDKNVYSEYILQSKSKALISGAAIGSKIATGRARVIKNVKNINQFLAGEVLITEVTDPDWEPIMKMASAIVTNKGGRTSHAAILSRELGIPAVVGTGNATEKLRDREYLTVDCSSGSTGIIYDGKLAFEVKKHRLDKVPVTKTKIMVNIGSPEEAFREFWLPVQGVGLGRLEFIIGSYIQIHPNALIEFAKLKNSPDKKTKKLVNKIEDLTEGYADKSQFYIDKLAEGIAKIATAFHPHDVIIRFSDFKTNEYRSLLGGDRYEPVEANPMLGWRGASRYYSKNFEAAFELECQAILKVRDEIGLNNVVPMVPFCRTTGEAKRVVNIMQTVGLSRQHDKNFRLYVMCEIPSNILQAEEFLGIFDGMSIGSNDLTQLTVGIDRDSEILKEITNENDPAVKKFVADVIKVCKARKKYIGICGQAPSDYPKFTEFLLEQGIDSISLNPDTVIKTISLIARKESELKKN